MAILSLILLFISLTAVFAAEQSLFEDFEQGNFGAWRKTGNAFGQSPSSGEGGNQPGEITGFAGEFFASSFAQGPEGMGSLTSPSFTIRQPYISFLIGGGSLKGLTSIQLLVDQKILKEAIGRADHNMLPKTWDVTALMGKKATLRLVDASTRRQGYILVDHILFSDQAEPPFPPATRNGLPMIAGLSGSSIIPGLQIPKNSSLKIFATHEEHGLHYPNALSIDRDGNLLVTETHRFGRCVPDTRDHPYWLHDDIAALTVNDRRVLHKKWNHRYPISKMSERSDRILLLKDTNKDGIADQNTIYADGFDGILDGAAGGVLPLDDRVYFACIPHIWSLRDTNDDGEVDERKKMFSGFGPRISLAGHDLDGFSLGPDGRLYGTVGDRSLNVSTQEGRNYSYNDQGVVYRFDPDGSHFEVVHTGLRDPQGITFDRRGNPVTVDSDSGQGDKARIIYIIDGADSGWRTGHQNLHTFHREIGYPQRPLNQWMQERQWDVHHEEQPAFLLPPVGLLPVNPAGLAYYPGTGFPDRALNSFLLCDNNPDPRGSGIWSFQLKTEGAGMRMERPQKLIWGTRATDLAFGNDGRLYVCDIIEQNKSEPKGRIFTLMSEPDPTPPEEAGVAGLLSKEGLMKLPAIELFELMKHGDFRVRLQAQLALANRPEAVPYFINATRQRESLDLALHGTWGLWIRARRLGSIASTDRLVELLANPEEELRAQAARALGEAPLKDAGCLINSLQDPSSRVRAFAAISLARLRVTAAFNPALLLLAENGDKDPYLRHAGVMALAGAGTEAKLAALSRHPSKAIRRASVLALRRLLSPNLIHFFFDEESEIADEAIRAVHDLPVEQSRPAVAALLDEYAPGQQGRPLSRIILRRILHSAFRTGGGQNASRLLRFSANTKMPFHERMEALRLLKIWTNPPVVDQSLGRYAPLPPRKEDTVKASLSQEIPSLLQLNDEISEAVLALAKQYEIPTEAP